MVDPGGFSDEAEDGLRPGTRLGKYEIVRLLGAGGMGAVYEASHTEIGKRVAIKVLSPAIAAVAGARARFLREAQLTSRVRHPNIVDVTDMGSDGGQTYLVMEFLRGEDLAQRLGRAGPLLPQQLADIMLPVCAAVVEAHKAGITHRDLKPQNIFLAVGPHVTQPKVLDFGISKGNEVVGAGTLTGTGAMIGTPFYLAPEQIMDTRAAGPNSDQYALGVIMYECLTGQRPYEAENLFVVFQAIVSGNPIPPSQRQPGIPAALEGIVLRAMHLSPAARYPSILNLGRALLPFASSRMRSIWEEAFQGSGETDAGVERPRGDSATLLAPTPPTPPTPALASREGAAVEIVPSATAERSRTGKVVAIFAVVIVGGLLAGLALQRSRSQPRQTAAGAASPDRREKTGAAPPPTSPEASLPRSGAPLARPDMNPPETRPEVAAPRSSGSSGETGASETTTPPTAAPAPTTRSKRLRGGAAEGDSRHHATSPAVRRGHPEVPQRAAPPNAPARNMNPNDAPVID